MFSFVLLSLCFALFVLPDVQKEIAEKVGFCLESDVAVVSVLDTNFKTVTIHRLDAAPRLVNIEQCLASDPDLPGLDIAVVELFS